MCYDTTMSSVPSLISRICRASGLSQRELARRAQTSNAALIGYEKGRHDPGLSTLARIADAGGCDLIIDVRPRLTPPEIRTLEMHKAIAAKFEVDPDTLRGLAKRTLKTLRTADPDGYSSPYFDVWERLLDGHLSHLTDVLVSTDQVARDLRQASPFSGILNEEERLDVLLRTDGARVASASGKSLGELRRSLTAFRPTAAAPGKHNKNRRELRRLLSLLDQQPPESSEG